MAENKMEAVVMLTFGMCMHVLSACEEAFL